MESGQLIRMALAVLIPLLLLAHYVGRVEQRVTHLEQAYTAAQVRASVRPSVALE